MPIPSVYRFPPNPLQLCLKMFSGCMGHILSCMLDRSGSYRVNTSRSSLIWDSHELVGVYSSFLTPQVGKIWALHYSCSQRSPGRIDAKFHTVITCSLQQAFWFSSLPCLTSLRLYQCFQRSPPNEEIFMFDWVPIADHPDSIRASNGSHYHGVSNPLVFFLNIHWNVMSKICMLRSELNVF